jgi:hypothetical protein
MADPRALWWKEERDWLVDDPEGVLAYALELAANGDPSGDLAYARAKIIFGVEAIELHLRTSSAMPTELEEVPH